MTLKLKFETYHAAFEDNPYEIGDILREVAREIDNGKTEGSIHDTNGVNVGHYEVV